MTTPPQQPGQDDSEDQSENSSTAQPEETEQNAAAAAEANSSDSEPADSAEPAADSASTSTEPGADETQVQEPQQEAAGEAGTEKFTPAGADATAQFGPAEQAQQTEHQATQDGAEQASATQDGAEQEPGQPAKRKKRRGLLIGAVAAAIIVIGGGVGAYFLWFSSMSAEATAQRYVDLSAQETQDPNSVTAEDYSSVVCSKAMPQIKQLQQQKQLFLQQAKPQDLEQIKKVQTELDGVQDNGDSGTATIKTTVPGQQPQSAQLKLIKESGDWKLCG